MNLVSLLTLQGINPRTQKSNNKQLNSNIAKAVSNNMGNLEKIKTSTYDIPNAIRYNSNFWETNFYMSPSEIVEKTRLLQDAAQNGYIYTFDTETFGVVPEKLNLNKFGEIEKSTANQIVKANANARIMSELYMSRQSVNGEVETALRIANTRDYKDMNKLVELVMDNKKTNDLGFILQRGAGLDGAFEHKGFKYPTKFAEDADILDIDSIRRGLRQMAANSQNIFHAEIGGNAQFVKDNEMFKKTAQNVLDTLLRIADEEHSVFQTMNGQNFDFDVLWDYFKMAGIEVTDEQKQKILSKHVDTQRLIMNTEVKDTVLEDIRRRKDYLISEARKAFEAGDHDKYNELLKQAEKVQENFTNTAIYDAAQGKLGYTFERTEKATHNGPYDVRTTELGTKVYYEDLFNAADKIEERMKNATEREGYFIANGNNLLDKEKDLFFSNEFDDITNTYNQVGTQKGHVYKVRTYKLNDNLDLEGLTAQGATDVREALEGSQKYVVEFEDQYN